MVEADEALALGLLTRIADDPLAEANELAAQIAAAPPDGDPLGASGCGTRPGTRRDAEALALEEELQRALIGALTG